MNDFIKEIEDFLERTGMSATVFGIKTVGSPAFVFDVRNGRQCLDSTKNKVLDFINNYEQEA